MPKAVRWALLALFVAGVAWGQWSYGNRHQYYDLGIYRQAVQWWLDGNALYDFRLADMTQGQLGFTYPPFGALMLVPFGVLPWKATIALYAVVTVGAVVLTTYWLVDPVTKRHNWSLPLVMVFTLTVVSALEPMRETYTFGQINMVLILLVLADLLVLAPRGSKWTGALIGIAAAIKLTPAIFILYLLVSKRHRAALTAIASGAVVTLLAAAVAPRASWEFWTSALWQGEGLGKAAYTFNQSIYAVLARLANPGEPNQFVWVVLALAALVFGLWRARQAALAGDEVVGLTLTGIVGSLISPITWAHHIYWFVPAMVVLVDVAARDRSQVTWPAVSLPRWPWLYGLVAAVVAATVGFGLISFYERGILPVEPWGVGLPGFVIRNWYLWLCIGLLIVLPVRGRVTAPDSRHPVEETASVR